MSNPFRSRAKRRLGVVAGLAAGAIILAGCSGSGGGGASGGVTTVTVMYASNEFTPAMVKDFEAKNPDIKINFIEFDQTRLNAMLTSGDAPDVVRGSPSANQFARGLMAPLDDYIAKSTVIKKDDLLPVNGLWQWDGKTRGKGKQYGLIKDWSADTSIWQNTALLQKAGIAPLSTTEPTDWDTILADAKKLKDVGVKYPLGLEWQWGETALLTTMVAQQGGELYNSDLTKINLKTPEVKRAFDWLVDYGKSGVGPTTANPLPDGSDVSTFAGGNMAMSMTGYWMGGQFTADDSAGVRDTVSMIPTPTWGTRVAAVAGGVGAYIPAESKNKDAAWKVLEYFIGGAPAVERSKSGWGLPAFQSMMANLPTQYPFQVSAAKTAALESDAVKPLPDSPYMDGAVFVTDLDTALMSVINGKATDDEALADLQSKLNTALAQGKDQLG